MSITVTTLDEVGAFIHAAGLGTFGVDLFKYLMPDAPDTCTALYEYGGAPGETGFSNPGLRYETPGIQVVCRGLAHDAIAPRQKIEAIYRLLATIQSKVLTATVGGVTSSTKYLFASAQQAPFVLERDAAKDRVKWAVNFLIQKELTA